MPPRRAEWRGTCRLDGRPSHFSYCCRDFAIAPAAVLRHLGVSAAEIAWLRAHPDHDCSAALRLDFARILVAPGDERVERLFLRRLEAWRASLEAHDLAAAGD